MDEKETASIADVLDPVSSDVKLDDDATAKAVESKADDTESSEDAESAKADEPTKAESAESAESAEDSESAESDDVKALEQKLAELDRKIELTKQINEKTAQLIAMGAVLHNTEEPTPEPEKADAESDKAESVPPIEETDYVNDERND